MKDERGGRKGYTVLPPQFLKKFPVLPHLIQRPLFQFFDLEETRL